MNDILDISVEFLLGTDLMHVLDDLIGLDVEFGHIEWQFFLLAEKTKFQILLDVVLKETSHWMSKKIVPVNAFVGVDHQHFAKDVFNMGVDFGRKHQWVFLDLLEQVDDVGSREGNPE